jgi:hypothetical protein
MSNTKQRIDEDPYQSNLYRHESKFSSNEASKDTPHDKFSDRVEMESSHPRHVRNIPSLNLKSNGSKKIEKPKEEKKIQKIVEDKIVVKDSQQK